jgi:hypothetical protein
MDLCRNALRITVALIIGLVFFRKRSRKAAIRFESA